MNLKKYKLVQAFFITCFSMLFLNITVMAQTKSAQELYQRGLAATCANCHGTEGKGQENASMPKIDQLTSEQILTQLKAFKSGARTGTIMPQLAKGYTDEQIQTIADYLGKKQ
jgi:cytochrome c553